MDRSEEIVCRASCKDGNHVFSSISGDIQQNEADHH